MCVVLVSCRRRLRVITPHQHRCDVILTSHACWEDEQLLLCGIIVHAKFSVVHHRGLSAVGDCNSADIHMECSIFVYRLNSFSIFEEYASVYCRNYTFHRISESYAERILFFYFFTTCPTPPLPCHTGRFCILGVCTLVIFFLLSNMAFLKGKLLNG